jgi:flagellar motor switch protein FliG
METLYAEEKAALLLMTLDADDAENVLERLRPEQGDRLRAQIQRLGNRPEAQEELDEVLREFSEFLRQVGAGLNAGTDRGSADVDYQVSQPTAPEPPASELGKPPQETAEKDGFLGELQLLAADTLSLALQGEMPRVVALVLDNLELNQAGEVLKRLPAPVREEVSLQLGRNVPVDPDILQCIAGAVVQKCQRADEVPPVATEQERLKKMADLLRLLPKPDRLGVIAALDQHDSNLAAGVKSFLYQFEDLLRIEDRSMQKLLAEVNTKSLAMALNGAEEQIRDKVLNNLSKRARETLAEEMEFLGTTPAAQVEEARKVIIDIVQRLDQAGELVMTE